MLSTTGRPDFPAHHEQVNNTPRLRGATSKLCILVLVVGVFAAVQIFNTSNVIKSINRLSISPTDIFVAIYDPTNNEAAVGDKVTIISQESVTCQVATTCGQVYLNGQRCPMSNFLKAKNFTGQYICYDSNGCDIGHQINAIALLSARFGDKFRVLDPMVYSTVNSENGEIRIQEISYATFVAADANITVPRETMHSLCSQVVNNSKIEEKEDARLSFAVNQHWYLSTVLLPFLQTIIVNASTCPKLPFIQDSWVQYSTNPMDDLGTASILQCSENIHDHNKTQKTIAEGITLPCDQPQITTIKSLESQHNYQSIAHKFLCNTRYLAQYPRQFSHPNVFVQRLIFAEMLQTGNKSFVYDINLKKRIEPLTRNETCRKCVGGCGCMTIPGFSWACDPFRKFKGNYVCYDSSHTGCGLGHQFNGIAALWKRYGEKLRIIDPIISGHRHPEYVGTSFGTFLKSDLLIPRDELMFEKCAYIDNGYDMGTNGADARPEVLVPFIDAHLLPCPAVPVIPDAIALKIRSTDMHANETDMMAHVKLYCDALQLNFSNFKRAMVMTDGPELKCDGFNITHFEHMEKPKYGSAAHEILCGIQYIARYPIIITRVGSSLLPIIIAERVRAGNNRSIFHVNRRIWVNF